VACEESNSRNNLNLQIILRSVVIVMRFAMLVSQNMMFAVVATREMCEQKRKERKSSLLPCDNGSNFTSHHQPSIINPRKMTTNIYQKGKCLLGWAEHPFPRVATRVEAAYDLTTLLDNPQHEATGPTSTYANQQEPPESSAASPLVSTRMCQ